MLFTTLRFIGFFLLVFVLHWALRNHRARKVLLLVASYVFYAAWNWKFLGLIVLSTAVDYVIGLALDREERSGRRRALLSASLVLNLGVLGLFKYFDFFTETGAQLLTWLGVPTSPILLHLVVPAGISFYTFQTLSYTIDVYRRKLAPTRDVLDFALFVGFFPQLVAGPIVRASEFLPQLTEPRRFDRVAFRGALTLFLFGFVKKACIADNLAILNDAVYADPEQYAPGMAWLVIFLYYVQVYCDFSAYSDMAIATGALLGYTLPLNFDFPLFSRTFTEFWQRWHLSLSTWFRDYLYVPLGGSRGSTLRTYRNLWLVFFLCALWHGAAWTFVAFGTIHGCMICVERAFGLRERFGRSWLPLVYGFPAISLSVIFFRAPDMTSARGMIASLAGGAGGTELVADWPIFLGVGLGFMLFHVLNLRYRFDHALERLSPAAFAVFIGAAAAIAPMFVATEYRPF
ncbi:MAG: MBOAT family O-acyltransferase, partial [Planctomycetota bacterium]